METEVADKARLIFSNLLAVQTYVRETLRPVMYEILPSQDFVIEAMSTSVRDSQGDVGSQHGAGPVLVSPRIPGPP